MIRYPTAGSWEMLAYSLLITTARFHWGGGGGEFVSLPPLRVSLYVAISQFFDWSKEASDTTSLCLKTKLFLGEACPQILLDTGAS